MAIQFKEIKKYIARNVRLSINHEDGYYENYLFMTDIPEQKYDHLYVYGIGMIDVEFSNDVYTVPAQSGEAVITSKDITLKTAIEIVLSEKPRPIQRSNDKELLFRDLKPYLQIGKNFQLSKEKTGRLRSMNSDVIYRRNMTICMSMASEWKIIRG